MAIEIRLADRLTDEERRQLFGWGRDIFNVAAYGLQWRAKDWHILVAVDGRVISHVGLLRHTVTVGDQSVMIAGVGAVVTVPDMQGHGYARRGLQYAASVVNEKWAVPFGLLLCHERLIAFYQRLGWRALQEPMEFEQPSGRVTSPFAAMVLQCGRDAWPPGITYLDGLPW
jgi:GNAT superfamily N-acetyltransferase